MAASLTSATKGGQRRRAQPPPVPNEDAAADVGESEDRRLLELTTSWAVNASLDEGKMRAQRRSLMSFHPRPYLSMFATAGRALILPAAFALAQLSLAAGQNAEAAAETRFLTVWSVLFLLAIQSLTSYPWREAQSAAVGATLLLWVLPHGAHRGAALAVLLVAMLVFVAARQRARLRAHKSTTALAVAVAAQACFRPQLLLSGHTALHLLELVGWPLLAVLLAQPLVRRYGSAATLLAVGVAVPITRGFRLETCLILAPLAATALWSAEKPHRRSARALAVALLLLPFVAQRRLALLGLLTAASIAAPGGATLLPAACGLPLALLLRHPNLTVHFVWALPVLLPWALVPGALPPSRLVAAALLALTGVLLVPGTAPLALVAAFVALAISLKTPDGALQASWTALLASLAALAAAYPWLRPQPLAKALDFFSLHPEPVSAIIAVACALGLAAWSRYRATAGARWIYLAPLALLLAVVAQAQLPPADHELVTQGGLALQPDHRSWEQEWSGGPISRVVLDSTLANAANLRSGTKVAFLELITADGVTARWAVVKGRNTGEWAARRFDDSPPPPVAWLSWLSADGSYFAQRYRGVWRLKHPQPGVRRLRLRLVPHLPGDVRLMVVGLEVSG